MDKKITINPLIFRFPFSLFSHVFFPSKIAAMPGDIKKLLRAFRHEREAAARNIRKVVAKQRADLRSAMIRYSVEFLGRGSKMQAMPSSNNGVMISSMSARDASTHDNNDIVIGGGSVNMLTGEADGVTMSMQMSGSERDVLYDMGSAGNNVTGFQPTLSSMGSAILSNGVGVATPPVGGGGSSIFDGGGSSTLPPLFPNR